VSARSSERTKPPGPVRLGPQCVAPLAAVSAWWVASTVRRHRAHSAYFCPLRGAGKRRSVLPTSPVRPASSDGPSPFSKAVTHAGVPAVSLCLPHTSAVQAVVSAKAGRRSVCSPTTQATCLGSRVRQRAMRGRLQQAARSRPSFARSAGQRYMPVLGNLPLWSASLWGRSAIQNTRLPRGLSGKKANTIGS
jgi:hypothetical protein